MNSNSFWKKTIPIFLKPERSVVIAITLITRVASGELKKVAISGDAKNKTVNRRAPRTAETVQAVSRYESTFSFFWIRDA